MRPTRVRLSASLLVAATLTAACTQQPLKFNTIQLGRGLNADKTVSGFTTRFKPTDTIYAAVLTDGAGSGKVKARWLYAGRVVSEPERDVTYQGPASTEFHIQNTAASRPANTPSNYFSTAKRSAPGLSVSRPATPRRNTPFPTRRRSAGLLPAALELCTSLRNLVQDGTPFCRRVPAGVSVHFLLHPIDPLEEEVRVLPRSHGPIGHGHVDGAGRRKRVEIEHRRARAVGVRADDVPAALIHVEGNARLEPACDRQRVGPTSRPHRSARSRGDRSGCATSARPVRAAGAALRSAAARRQSRPEVTPLDRRPGHHAPR